MSIGLLPQYKLVLISFLAFAIQCAVIFLYFKLKRGKINYVALLIFVSILPIISIFRAGSYESGDLSLHTMRTMSFFNILFTDHVIPEWLPEFNVGYGDPYFLFSYFLPYLVGAIFHLLGLTYLDSIKFLLIIAYTLSGVTMFYFAKSVLGEKAGFVSAIFYLFVPYHLVDMHFRVSIAETLSFVFLPLLLLLTKKSILKPSYSTVVCGAFTYFLLILTHQVIALIFSPFMVSYGLYIWFKYKRNSIKLLFVYFLTLLSGLLLSAFYWVPIISQARFTQASLTINTITFTNFSNLIYSPFRYGFLFQGHKGELAFIIGYTQILVVLLAIIFLIKNRFKETKSLLLFFLTAFFLLVFMITPQSKKVWDLFPLLKYAQFSYRFLVIIAICTSIIAGIVATKITKKTLIISLLGLTILYTILNWGNRRNVPELNDQVLATQFLNKPDVGMYLEPSSPIWADLKKSKLRQKPKNHIEILKGSGEIKMLFRSSVKHTYIINASTSLAVKENTLYFPGWKLLVDNKSQPITYTSRIYPGIIMFSIPKGLHLVELSFTDTPEKILSRMVSIVTFLVFFFILSIRVLLKRPALFFYGKYSDITSVYRNWKRI